MKANRIIIVVLFPIQATCFSLFAQAPNEYELKSDVSYREGSNLDDYMKERCKLDIHYPVNKTDFTTIVWFHGGGNTEVKNSSQRNGKTKGLPL